MNHIAEVTTRNIPKISFNTTLEDAGKLMRVFDTGILAVVEEERLLGTLSERDLAQLGCGTGLDPRSTQVFAICNRIPITCLEELPLRSALQLMRERSATWLLTLNRQGAVTGVVSLAELLDALIELAPEDVESDGPIPESVRRVRGVSLAE